MKKIIIGIQGDKGSTNEKACMHFANTYKWNNFEIKYLINTEPVLKALENKEIDYGIFAWKSSKGGLVKETQNAIEKYNYNKVDEVNLGPDHVLLSKGEIDINKRIIVYSHPQALKEHKAFLVEMFSSIEIVPEIDTALAAKKLRDNQYSDNSLVIAPIDCAEIYELDVWLKDLPANEGYETTFYLVR